MSKQPDPELAKLQAQVLERRLSNDSARVTDASMHLRRAMDIIVDVDTSPDIHEAAVAMDRAAKVLLRFLDAHSQVQR